MQKAPSALLRLRSLQFNYNSLTTFAGDGVGTTKNSITKVVLFMQLITTLFKETLSQLVQKSEWVRREKISPYGGPVLCYAANNYLKRHSHNLYRSWSGYDEGYLNPHGGPVLQATERAGRNTVGQGAVFLQFCSYAFGYLFNISGGIFPFFLSDIELF